MLSFDPYFEWLDIEPAEQPADHYRLLALARFEGNQERIERAADERMGHVRRFQTGPRGAYTQKLLNELSAARSCLLDPGRKAEYDAHLAARISTAEAARRAAATPPPAVTLPIAPPVPVPAIMPKATRRHSNWQAPLLVGSCLVAAALAAGGWLIGQWRTTPSPANGPIDTKSRPQQQPGAKQPSAIVVRQSPAGEIEFDALTATLHGDLQRSEQAGDAILDRWASPSDEAAWHFQVYKPGFFQAEVTYSTAESFNEGQLELEVDDRKRRLTLRGTGGLARFETDVLTVAVQRSSRHSLTVRGLGMDAEKGLAVQRIRFVPVEREVTP